MAKRRRRRAVAGRELECRQPGSELCERQPMQAERAPLLYRDRSRKVVDRAARGAEQEHLDARWEHIDKRSRFAQPHRPGRRLHRADMAPHWFISQRQDAPGRFSNVSWKANRSVRGGPSSSNSFPDSMPGKRERGDSPREYAKSNISAFSLWALGFGPERACHAGSA